MRWKDRPPPREHPARSPVRPSVGLKLASRQDARRSQPAKYQKQCESLFEYISINLLLYPPLECSSRHVDLDPMEVESFVDLDARRSTAPMSEKAGL